MNKSLAAAAAVLLLGAASAQAQGIAVTPAGQTPTAIGDARNFSGQAAVDLKAAGHSGKYGSVGQVNFMPGARTAWHTHPAGQLLVVTKGRGWVQEDGQPAREIKAGDTVWIEPGVRHWHGAAKDSRLSHIAIAYVQDGKAVDWKELVSDEQYNSARQLALAFVLTLGISVAPASASAQPAQESKTMSTPSTHPAADTLSARQQAILPIAAFAAAGDMAGLNTALNRGLDAGVSISDAREVLVQLYAYAGFPRSLNALAELMKVVDARKRRGIQDAPGSAPSRPIPKGDALLAAGTANQTRLSGGPVEGPLFDFAPVANEYLRTHLFGDIFERDNLDWQSRELATVSMLSALPGAESQLQSHMRISMNIGLTAGQLRQLTEVLAARADADMARRAKEALERQLAAQAAK